ncbi:MAG: biosynthetic arginine decarboxylase, partial [Deltaproteobacteria bacterium]|nr:biosynthetic arginine decarboxylase [Deltaproteobacteria bacterium]
MAASAPQSAPQPNTRKPNLRRERPDGAADWTVEDSAELFQIRGWGAPYFSVNARGRVEVRPDPDSERAIDLYDLAMDLQARGIELPILVRFSEILAHRIRSINEAFTQAIEEYEYKGVYRGVFPVKVNQQRHIVEEVVEFGKPWGFGLEVGSKPELLIALAMMRDSAGLVICNGYKDLTYIETALIAQRFDRTVIVVLERIEEFGLVLKASERLGIRPILGVRSKLATKGTGRWKESAGDRAKFGLTTAQIVELVDRLGELNMLDCLKLLHFHIGSQISSIIPIKNAIQEAANIYVELAKMGCEMGYLDVGGGLAIDYDGSKTDFHASRNYTLHEYAADVVSTIQSACAKREVAPPTIVSESGRAVVAHQSALIFDVVGANETHFGTAAEPVPGSNRVLCELYETWKGIRPKNVQESWHDAQQMKEEAQSLFKYGYLTLRERAQAE